MKKAGFQFLVLFSVFMVFWLGLGVVKWTEIFKIEENTSKLEKKLGDAYLEAVTKQSKVIKDKEVTELFDSLKSLICNENGINPDKIKIHLVTNDQVNAFAMPDNHMVIFTGLIDYCQSMEEVLGVMAHELAHMQKGHIMKKLSREIGFAALTSMASGGSVSLEALRYLTSTAYDRTMETEADDTAVIYLENSGINPAALADFMYRLSLEQGDFYRNLSFLSTHPASADRADRILELSITELKEYSPVFTEDRWKELQRTVSGEEDTSL